MTRMAARRELVDMGLFAAAPGFARASLRLRCLELGRAEAQARRLLLKAVRDVAPAGEPESVALWRSVYDDVGLAAVVPPQAALTAWARSASGIPSQGVLADIVNATSLRLGLPMAVYDLGAVSGDLWLRPARGSEVFEPIGGTLESVTINEPILCDDDGRCLALAWHGRQSAASIPTINTESALVHVDVLDGDAASLHGLAYQLGRLLVGFVGGDSECHIIDRARPVAHWSTQATR